MIALEISTHIRDLSGAKIAFGMTNVTAYVNTTQLLTIHRKIGSALTGKGGKHEFTIRNPEG